MQTIIIQHLTNTFTDSYIYLVKVLLQVNKSATNPTTNPATKPLTEPHKKLALVFNFVLKFR